MSLTTPQSDPPFSHTGPEKTAKSQKFLFDGAGIVEKSTLAIWPQDDRLGPKFCDFQLFREILAILGHFGENRFFRFSDFWDPPDRTRRSAFSEKWPVLAQKGSDFKNIFLGLSRPPKLAESSRIFQIGLFPGRKSPSK